MLGVVLGYVRRTALAGLHFCVIRSLVRQVQRITLLPFPMTMFRMPVFGSNLDQFQLFLDRALFA